MFVPRPDYAGYRCKLTFIITQFTPFEYEKRVVVFMKAKMECLRVSV